MTPISNEPYLCPNSVECPAHPLAWAAADHRVWAEASTRNDRDPNSRKQGSEVINVVWLFLKKKYS